MLPAVGAVPTPGAVLSVGAPGGAVVPAADGAGCGPNDRRGAELPGAVLLGGLFGSRLRDVPPGAVAAGPPGVGLPPDLAPPVLPAGAELRELAPPEREEKPEEVEPEDEAPLGDEEPPEELPPVWAELAVSPAARASASKGQ